MAKAHLSAYIQISTEDYPQHLKEAFEVHADTKYEEGFKSISLSNLVSIMLESVKELKLEIDSLEKRVEELEG